MDYIRKILLIILILFVIFGCDRNNINYNFLKEREGESNYKKSNEISEIEMYDFVKLFDNRLLISIYFADFATKLFYIKEFTNDGMFRYSFISNDGNLYSFLPNYDSLVYDQNILNEKTLISFDKDVSSRLSNKFWLIPQIRQNDTIYQSKVKNADDIKELEKIVNKLDFFKSFNFNDEIQTNTLIELIKLTQIHTVNQFDRASLTHQDFFYLFNNFYINQVKDTSEFKYIKNYKYWFFQLDESQIRELKSDFYNEGIYYFYTEPDYKLFKFQIIIESDSIILDKEFINKEFIWENPITFVNYKSDLW